MEKKFKYASYIENLNDCPNDNHKEVQMTAYRWVLNDWNAKNNFIPPLIITPKRLNSRKFDTETMKCQGYALSLYSDIDKGITALLVLLKRFPKLKTKFNCIAEGKINKEDGKACTPEKNGHFDFHEYEDFDLSKRFKIVTSIVL